MAQRLARKIQVNSKQEIPIDEAKRLLIDKHFADLPAEYKSKINFNTSVFEAISTPECPSGMLGRVPVYEMFKIDKEMQKIILNKPQEQDIYTLARSRGMLTIREDAIIKSMEGLIPFKEIYNF